MINRCRQFALAAALATLVAIGAPAGGAEAQTAAQDQLANALAALKSGSNQEALAAFDAALEADASNAAAVVGRARALEALGRAEEAQEALDALAASETAADAQVGRFERALLDYRAGRISEALETLEALAAADEPRSLTLQRLGDARYAAKDAAGALEAYRRAARLPGAGAALFRSMGNAAYALGDLEAAEAAYSEALIEAPVDGWAAYHRAWTREALGKWRDALSDYDLAVETIGAANPQVVLDRGRLLLALGAPAPASEDLATVLEATPSKAAELRAAALMASAQAHNDLGEAMDARARLRELRSLLEGGPAAEDPAVGVEMLFEAGRAALLSRDYAGAEKLFTDVLQRAPDRADARANRAIGRLAAGDLAGALEDWREAARLRPRTAGMAYGLARAAIAAGAIDVAERAAQTAENLVSDDPNGPLERARLLMALDRPFAALEALSAGANTADALKLRAEALRRLGREREALAAAKALTARAPSNPEAYALVAEAMIALGDHSGARIAIADANTLGADPARVAELAGDAWLTAARVEGEPTRDTALGNAVNAYDMAVRYSSGAPSALSRRAAAHRRLGALDEARKDLDRAVAAAPQDAELRFARASLAKEMGDCGAALADYDAGLSLRPENARARAARASCRIDDGQIFGAIADYLSTIF